MKNDKGGRFSDITGKRVNDLTRTRRKFAVEEGTVLLKVGSSGFRCLLKPRGPP